MRCVQNELERKTNKKSFEVGLCGSYRMLQENAEDTI
jgi:hypothetical protein